MKYYCGIGSRETPKELEFKITKLAENLDEQGYILRSGHSIGADIFFEKGAKSTQIWLPWDGFNEEFNIPDMEYLILSQHDKEAYDSVAKFHPVPSKLSYNAYRLMGRNYRQIVGRGEDDSQFVICWTQNGEEVGGTSQAIRIAKSLGIPIYNIFNLTVDQILQEIKKLNMLSE